MDPTKINLSVTDPALSGAELAHRLREEYGVQVELCTHRMVMCLTGLGTRWGDLSKLLQALHRITETHREEEMLRDAAAEKLPVGAGVAAAAGAAAGAAGLLDESSAPAVFTEEAYGEVWVTPHEVNAIPEEKEWVPLVQAAGRTAASAVTPYPPGVPALCPGEIYTESDIQYIVRLAEEGGTVMGVSENGQVLVGK
jgi:arginine/lysine/ornithine decarboxylase